VFWEIQQKPNQKLSEMQEMFEDSGTTNQQLKNELVRLQTVIEDSDCLAAYNTEVFGSGLSDTDDFSLFNHCDIV
jgi:hypothetical protein